MPAFAFRFEHCGEEYVVISRAFGRPSSFAALTPAELAVAEGIVEGFSDRELARQRAVSLRTIANQSAAVYQKLGIASRSELIALIAGTNQGRS